MAYPPRNPEINQERLALSFDHAALTANTTVKLWKAPAGRAFRVDRVLYINPTGLAADPANAFKLEVKVGATVVSEIFNTDNNDDPAGAALAADTFIEKDSAAEVPSRVVAADATLSLVFTEDGTATLPIGRLVVEGCLL